MEVNVTGTDIRRALMDAGVPDVVAAEVALNVPDAARAVKVSTRLGLAFVGVMLALFVLTIALAFFAMQALTPDAMAACLPDVPLNFGIACIVLVLGSIFAAGWIMTIGIEQVSPRLRYTYLAGSFLSENSAPYARWFNRTLERRGISFSGAEAYFGYWNRAVLPVYIWGAPILFGAAIVILILVPAICV